MSRTKIRLKEIIVLLESIDKNTSFKLKAFAAIVILVEHVTSALEKSNAVTYAFCKLAMFIFLFLSGYGLYISYKNGGGSLISIGIKE